MNVYGEVALKVKSLIKEKAFEYDGELKVNNEEVGKISHTYQSAIVHKFHWGVWVSAAVALAVDLVVPLFVFILTPRGQRAGARPKKSTGAKVLQSNF